MKAPPLLLSILLLPALGGAAAGEGSKECVTGTVKVSPSVAGSIASGGTLFVYIREAGRTKGPPTAVVTIPDPVYPQRFTLCGTDQMIGGAAPKPLSGHYHAYARHSPTGAPMVQEGFLGTAKGSGKSGIQKGDTVEITIDERLAK